MLFRSGAIDEQRLPDGTAVDDCVGDLALHVGQDDLRRSTVDGSRSSIGMAALNASNLKLHNPRVRESTCGRQTSKKLRPNGHATTSFRWR